MCMHCSHTYSSPRACMAIRAYWTLRKSETGHVDTSLFIAEFAIATFDSILNQTRADYVRRWRGGEGPSRKHIICKCNTCDCSQLMQKIYSLIKLTHTVQFFLSLLHRLQLPAHTLTQHDSGMFLADSRADHITHHCEDQT